jgi:hypothetical protein
LTAQFVKEVTLPEPLSGFTIELTAALRPKIIKLLPNITIVLPAVAQKTHTQSLSESLEARNVRTTQAIKKCAEVELEFMT